MAELPPPGWAIASATCDDDSEPDAIVVSPGEVVTCTFTNQQAGRITVVKDAQPDGPTDFTFVDDIPGCDIGTLDDDLDATLPAQATCLIPDPGTFSVTEDDPGPGYPLEALSCDDADSTVDAPSRTATIVVGAGEHVTCTFINVAPPPPGAIRVIKQTDPDGSTQSFTFDPSWSTTDFTLTDGQMHEATGLAAGNYSVSETPVAGWDAHATCDDGSTPGSIDLARRRDRDLHVHEHQRGTVIIRRRPFPTGRAVVHLRRSWSATDFSLQDGGSHDSGLLAPGLYSVSEAPTPDWSVTSATCDDDLRTRRDRAVGRRDRDVHLRQPAGRANHHRQGRPAGQPTRTSPSRTTSRVATSARSTTISTGRCRVRRPA